MNDIDELYNQINKVEREQNKILEEIPEWQEYKRESRQNGKKAKHNTEFFKKTSNKEARRNYKMSTQLITSETAKKNIWQTMVDWFRS